MLSNDRVSFDLNKHVAVDEPRHFDHAGGRADRPEDLAVRLADMFPIADVGHVDARADDILEARASFFERRLNILEHLDCLGVRVAVADDTPFVVGRGRA